MKYQMTDSMLEVHTDNGEHIFTMNRSDGQYSLTGDPAHMVSGQEIRNLMRLINDFLNTVVIRYTESVENVG